MTVFLLLAVVATGALTPVARVYAHRLGLIDVPDPRRLHRTDIARGGGIAMVVVFLLATAIAPWMPNTGPEVVLPMSIGVYVALMAGLGFWDDHRPVPARWRATGQVLLSVALLAVTPVSIPGVPWFLGVGLLTIVLVWWINLFNFMDGSNGFAATQALFIGAAVGVIAVQAAGNVADIGPAGFCGFLTAAVALGFLPWNFPKASVFMGDVGSYGLAAIMAVTALLGLAEGVLSTSTVLLLPAVFIVDATATLVWRVATGQRWYDAHREHLYQRLATMGAGSTGIVLGLVGVNVAFIWPAVSLQRFRPEYSAMIVITVYLMLTIAWLLAGRRYRGRQH